MATVGKAIKKGRNQKGVIFALVRMNNGKWSVLKLCSNYCGQVRGGIRKTWRVVNNELSEDGARLLYQRRIAGMRS